MFRKAKPPSPPLRTTALVLRMRFHRVLMGQTLQKSNQSINNHERLANDQRPTTNNQQPKTRNRRPNSSPAHSAQRITARAGRSWAPVAAAAVNVRVQSDHAVKHHAPSQREHDTTCTILPRRPAMGPGLYRSARCTVPGARCFAHHLFVVAARRLDVEVRAAAAAQALPQPPP